MNKCIDCNKKVSDYRIKRCRKCADKQHSKIMTGIKNPAYKSGLPKCKDCGKELGSYTAIRCQDCYHKYVESSDILKGRKIEWNNKISKTMLSEGTTKGKKNPMFGKVTHTKYIKYKNILMHSSWEVVYATYLDKQNIKWLYESKTFNLGKCTYTPDFYLPESDTYIEVKGYWRDDAKKKFKMFKKLYKDIKIKVLYKTDIFK